MKTSFVYVVVNQLDNRMYIGKSNNWECRWKRHLRAVRNGNKTKLYNAIRKYGQENFVCRLIETCDSEDAAYAAEREWIVYFQTRDDRFGYNLAEGGRGGTSEVTAMLNRARIVTSSTRRKMSLIHQKQKCSSETRALLSAVQKGRKHSDKHRLNQKFAFEKRRIRKTNIEMLGKQTLLLCGGPDRCGKTNILAELSKRIGVKVFKASSEHETFLTDQSKFLLDLRIADPRLVDFLFQTGASALFDRSIMCEYAYSAFYDRKTDLSMITKLDAKYAQMGAKILICTRKSFEGIQDDLDAKLNSEALSRISELYLEYLTKTKCQFHILNVDDENLDREVSEIQKFLGA